MLLKPKGPFNLALTLASGQTFRWQRKGDWHYGVVGQNIWKICQAGRALEFHSAPEPEDATAALARSYFRLDDDLTAIYRRIGEDRNIQAAIRRYKGLRLLRQDPWECLVSFVISAYSNIRRITGHVERLSAAYGEPVSMDGHRRHTFPSPQRLAEAGEQDLRAMGLGYRAKFLARLAPDILQRELDLTELRARPYAEAKAELLSIYGVGDKVADCVLLFSLDKLEAFPVDVHVRRAVTELYLPGRRVTDNGLRLWAVEHFGPLAGYAEAYLFHRRRMDGQAADRPPLRRSSR